MTNFFHFAHCTVISREFPSNDRFVDTLRSIVAFCTTPVSVLMLANGIILGGAYRDSNILRRERSRENDFDQRSVPFSGSESFVRRNRVKRASTARETWLVASFHVSVGGEIAVEVTRRLRETVETHRRSSIKSTDKYFKLATIAGATVDPTSCRVYARSINSGKLAAGGRATRTNSWMHDG